MSSEFHANIRIESPFPDLELPTLHVWMQKLRSVVGDDSVPVDLRDFVAWQQRRQEYGVQTWAAYKYEDLGAYFECVKVCEVDSSLDPSLDGLAQIRFVFKKEVMWGNRARPTALNLVLREVFETVPMAFFPVYKHNRSIQELLSQVGASNIGLVKPRLQNGNPVESVMWAVSAEEWERVNVGFLRTYEATLNQEVA